MRVNRTLYEYSINLIIKSGLSSVWRRHPSWRAAARIRRFPYQAKNILAFYFIILIEYSHYWTFEEPTVRFKAASIIPLILSTTWLGWL